MKTTSRKEWIETGMIITAMFLIVGVIRNEPLFIKFAIGLLIVNLIIPVIFKPAAFLWFGLSHILGRISSSVLLFVVYAFVLLPVGLVRKLIGMDDLKLKAFKKDGASVFSNREKVFNRVDLEKPY
jgi:Saxitoxin biosynthesis operon protein SxtJ